MIAVVDDDPRLLESLENLLESAGYAVRTFPSAKALVDAGLSGIDCLITDIGMPEIDGFEFLRRVQTLSANRRVPAIAVTAFARADDRERILTAGFDAHVSKPVDSYKLAEVIAETYRTLKDDTSSLE